MPWGGVNHWLSCSSSPSLSQTWGMLCPFHQTVLPRHVDRLYLWLGVLSLLLSGCSLHIVFLLLLQVFAFLDSSFTSRASKRREPFFDYGAFLHFSESLLSIYKLTWLWRGLTWYNWGISSLSEASRISSPLDLMYEFIYLCCLLILGLWRHPSMAGSFFPFFSLPQSFSHLLEGPHPFYHWWYFDFRKTEQRMVDFAGLESRVVQDCWV